MLKASDLPSESVLPLAVCVVNDAAVLVAMIS